MKKHFLHKVFEPKSIAIVGASDREGSVGAQLLDNIREGGFPGEIYPVNPKHRKVQGLKTYPSLSDTNHPVDLVVVAIPAAKIPDVMRQCGEHSVGAVIITVSRVFGDRKTRTELAE